MKGISVIIPNYNGEQLLPIILPPLYKALANTNLPFEVIVSDDRSTDNSIKFLEDNYKDIYLIKNKLNLGFSPTINKGIFIAKYDFMLLLNSDVKVSSDYFQNLLPYFDMPDTFGVMGRIIGWDDDTIQDGGKYPSMQLAKIKTSLNYIPLESKVGDRLYSMYLSGANAFVSREKLLQLRGFDEIFAPFYVEDFELSLRAWRLGWKCYYEHNAICRHKTSVTIKSITSKNNIRKIYYRNKMFLHAKHLNGLVLFLWHLQLIPETLIHLVTGRFWYFNSLQQYFASQNEIKRSKKMFENLEMKKNEIASVRDVTNKILNFLSHLKLIFFK